ncbi:MAG: DUF2170 family protein [Sneathiella sp.]|nr:DUF2170 family protein [Sneathiella sp.]
MVKDTKGALRQQRLRDRRRSLGLVQVEVWVPPTGRKLIRELESELNNKFQNTVTKDRQLMKKFTAEDLFTQLNETEEAANGEMTISRIDGETPVIQALVQDIDEFPVMVTVGEEQILAIVNLWTADDILDGKVGELNDMLLRANLPVPLSSFSIINNQYVLFGALSINSSISEVVEEITTLANNVIEALESCQEYLKS